MVCPKCQGEVFDNRSKKAAGVYKPNAPDFACANKDGCGWKSWPSKGKAPVAATQAPPVRPEGSQAPQNGPVGAGPRDAALIELYWDCFDRVLEGLKKRSLSGGFHDEQIAACTATLFIQRARG